LDGAADAIPPNKQLAAKTVESITFFIHYLLVVYSSSY
jgi:hypothetical protein